MTDFLTLPPLAALRALAAFAEAGTVVRAAAALNVSHPAVSQQLRALEGHLGVPLFDRRGGTLKLTVEGQKLAEAAIAGFAGMARVVEELTGADQDRPVMVTTTESLAANWLVPRLPDFRARHPEVSLMIDPTPSIRPLGPGGFDLAVRYGNGDWPGLEAELLLESPVVLVGAPKLLRGRPKGDLTALEGVPWLHELGTSEASDFCRRHGISEEGPGSTALPGDMAIEAARNGQGIALVARAFVEKDIEAGRLEVVYEDEEREGYWLVRAPGVPRPTARIFAAWLRRLMPEGVSAGVGPGITAGPPPP